MKEKNTASRLFSSIACMLISGIFLSNLSESWRRGLWHEFLDGLLLRRMQFMWHTDKQTFFMLLLCCIAAIVFVGSLIRFLILIIKLLTGSREKAGPTPAYHASRTVSRASKASGKTVSKKNTAVRTTTSVNGVNRGDVSAQAISCAHKNGKDKYLEQIEGFLKNGLIEKNEYDVLYARYKKLHISDNYH